MRFVFYGSKTSGLYEQAVIYYLLAQRIFHIVVTLLQQKTDQQKKRYKASPSLIPSDLAHPDELTLGAFIDPF